MIVGARQDARDAHADAVVSSGFSCIPSPHAAIRLDEIGLAVVHLDLVATTADVDVVPSAESVPKVQMAPRMKTKDPVPRTASGPSSKAAEHARETYRSRGIPWIDTAMPGARWRR